MTIGNVRKQVLELAKEGYLLPFCPECGMVLSLDEVKNELCKDCNTNIDMDYINWTKAEAIVQA